MWYYDPFIVVPAVLAGIALILAVPTTLLFRKDHMLTAGLFGCLTLVCTLASSFVGFFGWVLNNEEVINSWIGTILS